jgi:hypothetical protein
MNKIVEGPFETLEWKTIESWSLEFTAPATNETMLLKFTDGTSVTIASAATLTSHSLTSRLDFTWHKPS